MLPERASERVVIYVVDTIDLERMRYDEDLDTRDTYVAVVDAIAADPGDQLKSKLERRGLLIRGNTLLQNPYRPDEYATVSDAPGKYALDKFVIFSNLCQLLGARSVRLQSLEETKSGRNWTLDASAEHPLAGGGGARAASSAEEKIISQKGLHDTFEGGEPDIEAARDLLVQLRLDDDPILRSLVDTRAAAGNRHIQRQVTVDLSEETNNALSLAAKVITPSFFKLQVSASTIKSESVHLRVKYLIDF
jgi:hypothetical protein